MIMAAIGNELTGDALKGYVVDDAMERNLRPAIARAGVRLVVGASASLSRSVDAGEDSRGIRHR